MITVEIDVDDESVALFFDAKGGEELVRIISQLIAAGNPDHVHLTDYSVPPEVKEKFPNPSALSLVKISSGPSSNVASMLTVLLLKESGSDER